MSTDRMVIVCEHGSLQRNCLVCELTEERDAALLRAETAEAALTEERHLGKYYIKACVYGAIAAHYTRILAGLAGYDEAAAAALRWRHSCPDTNGVPAIAVDAIAELLDAARRAATTRGGQKDDT